MSPSPAAAAAAAAVAAAATSATFSSSSARRALSLYRSLLRAARSLPSEADRAALEEETKQRFRDERASWQRREEAANGKGTGSDAAAAAWPPLLDEAEARLHDAVHHGIPYARLEHAQQVPRAVIDSARGLFRVDEDADGGGKNDDSDGNDNGKGIKLPRNASARRALEAALKRRAAKRQQQQQRRHDDDEYS